MSSKAQQELKCHSVCTPVPMAPPLRVCVCVVAHVHHVCTSSTSPRVQPLCVRQSATQKGGPLLGLCQRREDEGKYVTSMQIAADGGRRENSSTVISPLHPTRATRFSKRFLLKIKRGIYRNLLPLQCVTMMSIMHV